MTKLRKGIAIAAISIAAVLPMAVISADTAEAGRGVYSAGRGV